MIKCSSSHAAIAVAAGKPSVVTIGSVVATVELWSTEAL